MFGRRENDSLVWMIAQEDGPVAALDRTADGGWSPSAVFGRNRKRPWNGPHPLG